jgi:hypothetical protein
MFFSFLNVYSQDKYPAIIDWKYLGIVNIYDNPDGKIIYELKNDSINEDYLHLDILAQNDAYFYVSISLTINKNVKIGWIKKADYIGAYIKHEKFPMDLIIYKDKKISDNNKIVIKGWTPTLVTIEKYAEKWMFISIKHDGKTIKGWIEINELCANSYSTCS